MKKIFQKSLCLLLVFTLILGFNTQPIFAGTIVDGFVKITSVSQSSYGKVTINYRVIKDLPPDVGSFYVGYQYPSTYRTSGKTKNIPPKTLKGSYSVTLDVDLIGNFTVIAGLVGRYSETSAYKTCFNAPSTKTITYHEVSTVEAISSYTVYYAIPGLYFTFYPGKKLFKFVGGVYAAASVYSGYKGAMDASASFPNPVKGHYYKMETWYENGKLYNKTTVWTNRESFSKGVSPIFSGSTYATF